MRSVLVRPKLRLFALFLLGPLMPVLLAQEYGLFLAVVSARPS